jgi:hypothetical protein
MVDLVEVGEGSMHGAFSRGGEGAARLGRDLYMVDFAEVGEGPPFRGSLHG